MNRRTVLRSAAATLWLPLLPSALPREARAATSPKPRLVVWFVPNGFVPEGVAHRAGTSELPPTFASLAPLRDRTTLLVLDNPAPKFPSHDDILPTLLSDHEVPDIHAYTLQGSITADQFVAQTLASVTPFASLQLGTRAPAGPGLSRFDAYIKAISWADATTPLLPTTDPKATYDRMFSGYDRGATEAEIARRTERRTSVLDAVHERLIKIEGTLSAEDRQKLDQYASALRDFEQRLDLRAQIRCAAPEEPAPNRPLAEQIATHNELMAIALSCDLTRVITFMAGPSTSMATLPEIGVRDAHHVISHGHTSDASYKEQLLTLERWHVEQFSSLAARLAESPGEDGQDLLSSTALLLATEFRDGSVHLPSPVALALLGAERSGFRHGLSYAPSRPIGALMRTLIEHMGVDSSQFGSASEGTLSIGA